MNNKPFKIVPIKGDNISPAKDGDTSASRSGCFDDFIVEGFLI
jgi:hypothetical protein